MNNIFDFSSYNIPENCCIEWWELQPTIHLDFDSSPSTANASKPVKTDAPLNRTTSAYALFFRERQSIEKRNWPNATFGQLSQLIARQWEQLSPQEKMIYRKRCETTRKNNITKAIEAKTKLLLSSTSSQSSTTKSTK